MTMLANSINLRRSGGTPWYLSPIYAADGISPSLIMDFKNNRYYSNGSARLLSDLLTFTRASTATYIRGGVVYSAAVNEARIGTNGLLIEIARTNLIFPSADWGTGWTKTNCTASTNVINAPDGTATADLLTENSATGTHETAKGTTVTATSIYTVSVFAKTNGRHLQIEFGGAETTPASQYANFDLSAGTVGTDTTSTARIQALANGWYRCSITVTAATTALTPFLHMITNSAAARDQTYTGDSTSGFYLWGAQVENASQMSSYIPTVASSATRAVDEAISTTVAEYGGGSGAQNWFLHSAGTALFKYFYDVLQVTNDTTNFTIGSGLSGNYVTSWENKATGYPTIRYVEASTQIDTTPATGLRTNADNIGAIAYAANNGAVAFNGGAATPDATVTIVASGMTQFNIGSATARASVGARGTREYPFFAFYPARISNSELTRITT